MACAPVARYDAAPLLGAHTDELLGEELGLSDEQVEQLRASGAIC